MRPRNAICVISLLGMAAMCRTVPLFRHAAGPPKALPGLLTEQQAADKSRKLCPLIWPQAGFVQVQLSQAGCYSRSTRPGELMPFWSVTCQSGDERYHVRFLWDATSGKLRQVVASLEHPGNDSTEYPVMQKAELLEASRVWISDLALAAGDEKWKLISCAKQGNNWATVQWRSPQTSVVVTVDERTGQLRSADVRPRAGGAFKPMIAWMSPSLAAARVQNAKQLTR